MINLFGEITVKDGCETEVYQALQGMLTPSRNEPGCLEYRITQSTETPTIFLTFETFQSMEDMEAHLASDHFQELLKKAEPLLAEPPKIRFSKELVE